MFLSNQINIIKKSQDTLNLIRSNMRQAVGDILLGARFHDNQDLSLRFTLSRVLLGERDHYFSQLGQDKRILEELYPKITDGFFIEVGANNGRYLSNTLALEQRGRLGICIEPGVAFEQLKLNRACSVENCCILDYVGQVDFYDSLLRKGLFNGIAINNEIEGNAARRVVNSTTLTSLLSKYDIKDKKIHYLSIDTEGSEIQVLLGIDFEVYDIGAITIEHNFDEKKRNEIKKILKEKGFVLDRKVRREDRYINPDFIP